MLCAAGTDHRNARERGLVCSRSVLNSAAVQTQDSAESLGLLLKELYNSTGAKSVISADTVLPLLLIADKYDVEAMVLRCAAWLNDFDGKRLKDTLLTVSPMRGERTSHKYVRCYRSMRAVLTTLVP